MADAVEVLAQSAHPSRVVCTHPVDARIDFGVTKGRPDWQCSACGFRSVEVC